ncbi:TIGR02466 family protein [Sphingomonas montana]|uniref:TIGR02466 family protein n=1 Tax=Sphingomonas montana TaxID=1843236 RepID=UPI00096D1281|nr:TIGR02466 family protein [Sphingomonas montana]
MTTRSLFATRFYEGALADADLLEELDHSCRTLAQDDRAGRAWCKAKGYPGYTSYASLDDLPMRDPAFADLKRKLDAHVQRFATESFMDLGGRKLKLDSLWVNVLKPAGMHSGHLHPGSVVSGTVYIAVPPGAGPLKLEDPRLPMMMAAPQRTDNAPEDSQTFVYARPEPGSIFLWESWLRHEVAPGTAKSERISVSFNYRR